MPKIWTNSGDSHFLEPADLWESRLPKRLADLTPKAEKDPDGEYETVRVDGQTFRRKLPTSAAVKFLEETRKAVGIRDARLRLRDLDQEGVWGEVIFPSLGMWSSTFRTPELLKACMRASNEWALEEVAAVSDRYVVTAQVSTLAVEDAVAELEWAAGQGFRSVFLPTTPHPSAPDWHRDDWEPFWAAAERAGMVLAIHIGTDPVDLSAGQGRRRLPGPGRRGHELHRDHVLRPAGGDEAGRVGRARPPSRPEGADLRGRRQLDPVPRRPDAGGLPAAPHGGPAEADPRPQGHPDDAGLRVLPARRDARSRPTTRWATRTSCSGRDYPHMEGTYGHTQDTLKELFDGVSDETRLRITQGAFAELFPHVPPAPADEA